MAVGVLFGPNAANIVPHEEFFRLAGVFGVRTTMPPRPAPHRQFPSSSASSPDSQPFYNSALTCAACCGIIMQVTLMIFESGLHVDFAMLRKVGLRASVVAVLGTFLPLVSGMLLIMVFDPERYELWPVGLAVGVTLAPTSVGMALKMLGEKKQLGEEYGQLIVTVRMPACLLLILAAKMHAATAHACARAGARC